ncbi:hypothetical protein pb186bvf_005064 [Paramecium bursaria]
MDIEDDYFEQFRTPPRKITIKVIENKDDQISNNILDSLYDDDPDQSFVKMQQFVESYKPQKEQLDRSYHHSNTKINELLKEIDTTLADVLNLEYIDQQIYEQQLDKLNTIKKLTLGYLEKYFKDLRYQYLQLSQQSIQQFQDSLVPRINELKNEFNIKENVDDTQEQLERIKNQIEIFKTTQHHEFSIQVQDSAFNELKDSLRKLIKLDMEDGFDFIPDIALRSKQKTVKLKNGPSIQMTENTMVAYQDKTLYLMTPNESQDVKQIRLMSDQLYQYATVIIKKPQIFILGQYDEDQMYQDVFVYNLDNQTLLELDSMPAFTYSGQVILVDNYIYYWGGIIDVQSHRFNSRAGYRYDIIEDKWTLKPKMIYPRTYGQIVQMNNKIFIFGGFLNQYSLNTLIEVYDLGTEMFEQCFQLINEICYTPQVGGYALYIQNNEILLIGGYGEHMTKQYSQLINVKTKSVLRSNFQLMIMHNEGFTNPIVFLFILSIVI